MEAEMEIPSPIPPEMLPPEVLPAAPAAPPRAAPRPRAAKPKPPAAKKAAPPKAKKRAARGGESQTMVQDHEPSREEELGRQRHAAAVRGDDGGADGCREVDAAVGGPRVPVDDASGAEAHTWLVAGDGPNERVMPESLA